MVQLRLQVNFSLLFNNYRMNKIQIVAINLQDGPLEASQTWRGVDDSSRNFP